MSTVQATETFQQITSELAVTEAEMQTTIVSTDAVQIDYINELSPFTHGTVTQNSLYSSELSTEQATVYYSIPENDVPHVTTERETYTTESTSQFDSFTELHQEETTVMTVKSTEQEPNHSLAVVPETTSAVPASIELTTVKYLQEPSTTVVSASIENTEASMGTTMGYSTNKRTIYKPQSDNESIKPRKKIDKRLRLREINYSNSSLFSLVPKTRFCTSIPTKTERYVGILCQIEKYKFIAGRDSFPGPEYVYLMLNEARYHRRTCNLVKRRKRCVKRKLPKAGPKGWGAVYPRTSILYDALSQTLKKDCSKYVSINCFMCTSYNAFAFAK